MGKDIPVDRDGAIEFINFALYTYFRLHEPDAEQDEWRSKADTALPDVLAVLAGLEADDATLEVQRAEVEAARRREIEATGAQRVVCGGAYTYEWIGEEPLEVGDVVLTEGNWIDSSPVWTVTATSSDYLGACKQVRRVLKRA